MVVLAADVWHFWIAVALVFPIILAIIATGVLYVRKVGRSPVPEGLSRARRRRLGPGRAGGRRGSPAASRSAESYHSDSLAPDFAELTDAGRGAGGRRDRPGLAGRSGPGPGHRPRRLGAGQRGLVPAAAAARSSTSSATACRGRPARPRWPRSWPAPRWAWCWAGCRPRVLGQYDLLIIEDESPHDQDLVYYVGPNVLALEKRFAFPPREFRLWLALHEVTHRAQFTGVPWMRPHFLGPGRRHARRGRPRSQALRRALAGGRPRRSAHGAQPAGRRRRRGAAGDRPSSAQALDQVGGLMSLLEGHGDITMDRAGAGLRAQRRALRPGAAPAAPAAPAAWPGCSSSSSGSRPRCTSTRPGRAFIEAVEAVGGPALLDRAWEGPRSPAHARRDPRPRPTWLARRRRRPWPAVASTP